MLASRRFQAVLGCYIASALTLVLADTEAAFNPQHIVLGKNGQVQDVDPRLYFHERAKKKTSTARASVVRTEFQHTQQYQLKATGHVGKTVAAAADTRSPKLSISRVNEVEVKSTKAVETQLHTVAATHGGADPSDVVAVPQPHNTNKEITKKVVAVMTKAPGSTELQRRGALMDHRTQAQESDDEFAQTPAPCSLESPEQAVDVPEASLAQIESFESALPGVPGSILFAEMSCIFVGFIGYLVHSIPLWARFSRGQRWCLVIAFSAALMYQLAALSWYLDWVSPEVMIGLSSLITRMISLGMVPITTTSFVGRTREACSDQPDSVAQQAQTQQQLANTAHNNSSSRGSRHHHHPRARAS